MPTVSELHDQADKYAEQYKIPGFGHNDARDAFRHAYASAVMARDYGATLAAGAGQAWEAIGLLQGEPVAEAYMDLWNNSAGRDIADQLGDKATNDLLAAAVKKALDDGKLVTLPPSRERRDYSEYLMRDLQKRFKNAEDSRSPLVLDLDGDGVETTALTAGTYFDHDGNTFAEATGWVGKDDGLLVLDKNGNGTIDNGSELFGNNTSLKAGGKAANGFAALADLDGNADGKLDSQDAAFAALKVWKDSNGDGITQAGELLTLTQAGVASLATGFTAQGSVDANGDFTASSGNAIDANGNQHRQVGAFTKTDGTTAKLEDVWFKADGADTVETDLVAVSADVAALPDIEGFGNVHSLHQAMQRDSSGQLKSLIQQFATATDSTTRDQLVTSIIYYWAGVQNVDPNSRAATKIYGNVIGDARKLEALEQFLGEEYLGTWCWGERDPNPHGVAAPMLLQSFDELASYVSGRLLLQTEYKSLVDGLDVKVQDGKVVWVVDAAVSALQKKYAADNDAGLLYLAQFAASLKTINGNGDVDGLLNALRAAGDANGSGFAFALGNLGLNNNIGDAGNNTLTGTDAKDDSLYGLAGNDRLYGMAGRDRLDGGAGDDYLAGGDGADTYIFGKGSGHDTLLNADSDGLGTNLDVLQLGSGITTADVTVKRDSYDLILTITSTGDSVRVQSYFDQDSLANQGYAIDKILFADGTVWTPAKVKALVLQGSEGNDAITGYESDDVIDALAGNDTIYGHGGNDTLSGGDGNDTLYGEVGSDTLIGGSGDDNLQGGDGNDTLQGGSGNDTLYGQAGNDTLTGGSGNDYLQGNEGADTYLFGKGSGQDAINNNDSDALGVNADTIKLSVKSSDVVLTRSGDSLYISIKGTDDRLEVQSYFYKDGASAYAVESLQFSDGKVWDIEAVKQQMLISTAGDDVLAGYASNDILSGGDGNDTLYGQGGDDSLNGGYGNDNLQGGDGNDKLVGSYGNDYLYGQAGNDTLSGGAGNDNLNGDVGNDLLDGGAGNDSLQGNGGADTYQFGKGYGQDSIYNYDSDAVGTNADTIKLSVKSSDVVLTRSGDSLYISIKGTDDRLEVQSYFYQDAASVYAVETLQFADGKVWDVATVKAKVQLSTSGDDNLVGYAGNDSLAGGDGNDTLYGQGGDDSLSGGYGNDNLQGGEGNDKLVGSYGNDTLYGQAGNDTLSGGAGNDNLSGDVGNDLLDGGAGNDYLQGNGGADTYQFGKGYGQDSINNYDNDAVGTNVDTIKLAVKSSDVVLTRSGDSLYISIKGTDDRLEVQSYFYQDATSAYAVETLQFADGKVWDVATVKARVQLYSDGNDNLVGYAGNDSLAGGDGNDTLYGQGGDDVLSGGTGNDNLQGGDGSDKLVGGSGSDTLYGQAGDDTLSGGSGNDNLSGDLGNDLLDGGAGNDYLNGGSGADTYQFGKGSGQDTLYNYDSDAVGTNADTVKLTVKSTDVVLTRSGDSLYISIKGTDDRLEIQSYFYQDAASVYAVETLQFADGKVWDVATVKAKVQLSTDGNDNLVGYAGNDILAGGDGNDTLYGQGGDDSLNGGYGNDNLQGGEGNDKLVGSYGNDTLYGQAGDDILSGGAGNDNLSGDVGNDQLDGGAGNDSLQGNGGADTYLFGRGSGQDTLYNYDSDAVGTNADTVKLAVNSSDVVLTRSGDSLYISIKGTNDRLEVQSYFYQDGASVYAVETLQFADGKVWDVATVKAKVQLSTDGNDNLVGYAGNDNLDGGDGNDTLYGQGGDDTLDGGYGNDNLQGNDGNDKLTGGAGNDTLYGQAGDDTLLGGAGNDSLSGDVGNDLLDGGAGNDYLQGNNGADTYLFGKGSGQDTIYNYDSDAVGVNADTILLGAGLTANDVVLTRSGDTLSISIKGTDDRLDVQSYFYQEGASAYVVETIKFADGTSWDLAAVKSNLAVAVPVSNMTLNGTVIGDVLTGGAGNDYLYGQGGNDILDGGAGNDYLDGGTGNDTYLFGKGSGKDSVNAYDATVGKLDLVQLGAGIAAADLAVSRDGDTLVLAIKGSSDVLRINSFFYNDATYGYQLEQVKFADGTSWDLATIKGLVQQASSDNDSLIGYATADSLNGLAGEDTLSGRAGNDTLNGGAGDDRLYGEEGNDTLLGGSQNDTLDGGNGDDTLNGGDGNDGLYGQNGNDILDGGAGDDSLDGGAGNDTYLFGRGSGKDTISAYDNTVGKQDVVQLGAGIAATDLAVSRDGDTLVLAIKGSSDVLRINSFFYNDATYGYQLEQVKFADGSSWDLATIKGLVQQATSDGDSLVGYATADSLNGLAGEDTLSGRAGNDTLDGGAGDDRLYGEEGNDTLLGGSQNDSLDGGNGDDTLTGGDGNDTLYGQNGNDILDGGAGNDSLDGGAGNDTYLFGKGSGKDTISAYDNTVGKQDVVQLGAGIAATDLAVTRDGDTLVLAIKGSNDVLRINSFFYNDASSGYQLEQVKFADGTSWSVSTIKGLVQQATADSETLIGYATADTLNALAGEDILYGRGGNDSLDGGAGDDRLYGEEGNDTLLGGSQNDSLDGGNGDDTLNGGDGNDTLYGQAGNDILDGGAGNDSLDGGAGNDTYLFGKGSGKDTISAYDGTVGKQDVVQLGAGIAAADLAVSRDGDTLQLAIKGSSDVLRINNFFYNDATYGYQLEQVKFADGSSWDLATIKGLVQQASTNNDTLIGYASADELSGLDGDDTLAGRGGIDTLDGGNGEDRLYGEEGNDTLLGGGQNDYLDGGNGDDLLSGQQGNDTLCGQAGNDILDGGAGNDYLDGGAGNDTYLFGRGSGKDTISSYDGTVGKVDTIELGSDITTGDVTVGRDGDTLVLNLTGSSDTLRVNNYFYNEGTYGYQVDKISFADGTDWDVATIKGMVQQASTGNDNLVGYAAADQLSGLAGEDTLSGRGGNDQLDGGAGDDRLYGEEGNDTLLGAAQNDYLDGGNGDDTLSGGDGNDTLYGQNGNDSLSGGAGNDYLNGGAGSDSYLFGRGDGHDTIAEYDANGADQDLLQFSAGVNADQLWFSHTGNDLTVAIIGSNESVTLQNWYSSNAYHVDQVKAGDGKTLLDSQVANLVSAMATLTPPAAGESSLSAEYHTKLDAVLAASWK